MDEHIKELFGQVQSFYESDLFSTPECTRRIDAVFDVEDRAMRTFGKGTGLFLLEYLMVQHNVFNLACQHYFYQGYLMGQAELQKDKNE